MSSISCWLCVEEGPAPSEFFTDLAGDQAWRMNISRASCGFNGPKFTRRRGIDDDAVQRDPLESHACIAFFSQCGSKQLRLSRCAPTTSQPRRFDARDAAGEEPRGFADLGGDDPLAGLLLQRRAGMDQELDAARAEVVCRILRLAPDVAEQAGEQRAVDGVVGRRQPGFPATSVLGRQRRATGCAYRAIRACAGPIGNARDKPAPVCAATCGARLRAWYQSHSLSQERNSDFSSANFRCASMSALPCRSCGRSRGSWTVSAAAITSTSRRQPSSRARQRSFARHAGRAASSPVPGRLAVSACSAGHRAEFEQQADSHR
jgi:hypothetical protein